ncbi:alpha/beta hydrolase [Chondromyces crocatus]|uniref:AB hydrolase-1 domain-containing protein n=1 Tax=Chondromyces crocatus TaxID=52 RepID=A0A0K1ECP2_CHOCO|nr:alpha/beta fold hydrolase [Chondromyces crocatus]AKT38467.1 uncharacterized protein CMC5_026140 [Chondromyces crocatus]
MKTRSLSFLVGLTSLVLCAGSASCGGSTGDGGDHTPTPPGGPTTPDGEEPEVDDDASPCRAGERGRVLTYEKVDERATAEDTQAYFDDYITIYTQIGYVTEPVAAEIQYGIDSYRVTYCTVDAALADPLTGERRSRKMTAATGMVSIPRTSGAKPVALYLHGTSVSNYDAPSNPSLEESFDGPVSTAIFAGSGFIYVAPDYLGLGGSPLSPHRYFHAPSEASSAVDLLTATDAVLTDLQDERSSALFLFGFSQGGHAALAAHQELQDSGKERVKGTATAGGVFDVERFFLSSLANEETATLPLYVSYLLVAYDAIYNIYQDPSEAFRPEYASTVTGLFDMEHYFDDVLDALGPTAKETLEPTFHDAVLGDAQHALRKTLRQNQVDDWRPTAPIRSYHSPSDEEVSYTDAQTSVAKLNGKGGSVTLETLNNLDHVNSWLQAMPRAVTWFRGLE